MDIKQAKLRWACRRGMLELDLLLLAFLEKNYTNLTIQEKNQFEQLLARSDQELYGWLIKREAAPEPDLACIIASILSDV